MTDFDFQEWARQVCAGVVLMRAMPHVTPDRAVALSEAAVGYLLKAIWNARGAADAEVVERRIRDLMAVGVVDSQCARHVAVADVIGTVDA